MILKATGDTTDRVALAERIGRYLNECPAAVSGAGGHDQTFFVACKLVNGFALSDSDALAWLQVYNQKCQPPWSDRELAHKIKSATAVPHEKPRGHLLESGWTQTDCAPPSQVQKAQKPRPQYDTAAASPIPNPMPEAMCRLLEAAFEPGEGVAISKAKLNADGRCVPDGAGQVFTRDTWLDKLDQHDGDADALFKSPHGVFIRVNPLRIGGSTDADVTRYRHALVEFDQQSMQEQWAVISQSGVPCAAVLTSGNRSIHAWVRVDAKDATEYAERVAILYDHFSHYGVDVKNRNPSRFSRLPGVRRGDGRQELLATHIGAKTWQTWLADAAAAGIGEQYPLDRLLQFEPEQDPSSIIGNRWVCAGGSVLWVGQSGIGKSALGMQAAITWALGEPLFGIKVPRPLKSLVIQAENDLGDTAEMLRGVLNGAFADKDAATMFRVLSERLIIVRLQTHVGRAFADAASKLIQKHGPDLVWVDPLFSFFGDDISNQKACSQFLREWLNPIASATGVAWMLLHHTGKPAKDPKAYGNWKSNDFSYMGTGSSELVNWARATCFLKGIDDGEFVLLLPKRGHRAGATTVDGEPTTEIYMRHSESGICWVQGAEPPPEEDFVKKYSQAMKATAAEIQCAMHSRDIKALIQKHSGAGKRTASKIWNCLKPLLIHKGGHLYERDPKHY